LKLSNLQRKLARFGSQGADIAACRQQGTAESFVPPLADASPFNGVAFAGGRQVPRDPELASWENLHPGKSLLR
jgi:hypothetical protein